MLSLLNLINYQFKNLRVRIQVPLNLYRKLYSVFQFIKQFQHEIMAILLVYKANKQIKKKTNNKICIPMRTYQIIPNTNQEF